MGIIVPYNRERAVEYAKAFAYQRDTRFFDFTNYGGNCTAFVSQCLYYANQIMNPTPILGWYYHSAYNRSPSWSGVNFLYDFLTTNKTLAPFGRECEIGQLEVGDIIQLKFFELGTFTHTLMVTSILTPSHFVPQPRVPAHIYVTANSFDALNRNLTSYHYEKARYIKIEGVYV